MCLDILSPKLAVRRGNEVMVNIARSTYITLSLLASTSALAQTPPTKPIVGQVLPTSWQNAGSEIPLDPAWRTGTLPNGLRFAVRRGTQPPGSISVRIRVADGALMETDEQQGWTHMLEHMVFRGTDRFADGEGIKIWQRLGASFGSDTNAFTTLTATTFVLDLPKNDGASYDQAMAVLADMLSRAKIDPVALATERKVVLAERALRMPPIAEKVKPIANPLLLAGTKAADRDVIGSEATLNAASAGRLKAYYKRWYRPSRTVVVVTGDADPAMLEAGVRRAFGDWSASGSEPSEPDYGTPVRPAKPAAVVTDPLIPNSFQLAYVTPHDDRPWTVSRQQRQYLDWIAVGILNARLGTEAQKGEAIVNAGVALNASRHVQDQLTVGIVPKPGAWKAALDTAYGVLNGAIASPPTQAEIDQQVTFVTKTLDRQVAEQDTRTSADLASSFIGDVDQGDVSGPTTFYRDLFVAQQKAFTPTTVQADIRRLLSPDPRLIVYSSTPVAGGDAAVQTALADARRVAASREAAVRTVSFDDLKLSGHPATVASISTVPGLGVERVLFSNGVELDLKQTAFERDKIRVSVLIGHGVLGERPNDPGLIWTNGALLASGYGGLSPDELTRLLSGRAVGFGIGTALNGVLLRGNSDRNDVADMFRLMTVAMTQMNYRPAPLARLKDATNAAYQAIYNQPGAVFAAFATPYLFGGDTRFRATPPIAEVDAVTLPAFQSYWQQRLSQGPVKIGVVGDFDRDAIISAVARSFGTLPPRQNVPLDAAQRAVSASLPATDPVVLRHRGDPTQAMVARIWPTQGLFDDVTTGRALELAASLIQTRLTEGFRETQGGSYAPFVSYNYGSGDIPHYGALVAGAQLRTDRMTDFDAALKAIITDIAAHGPDADAFARAKATTVGAIERARNGNDFWAGLIMANLDNPAEVAAIRDDVTSRQAVTPAQVRAAVSRFADPSAPSFEIEVLPELKTQPKR